MGNIKELIKEGESLLSTFTEMDYSSPLTTDITSVSTWNTKCMRIVEQKEKQGNNSQLYKVFESHVGKINRLTKNDFEELIGILKGIKATSEDDENN